MRFLLGFMKSRKRSSSLETVLCLMVKMKIARDLRLFISEHQMKGVGVRRNVFCFLEVIPLF